MLIVSFGNAILQEIDFEKSNLAEQVMSEIEDTLPRYIGRLLEACLDEEVTHFLGRKHYQRRRHAKQKITSAQCQKCQSRERRDFRRNGHYSRGLATTYGHIRISMPQLKCECGGYVAYQFKTILPGQRMGVDVKAFIEQEYETGASYRQIKAKLDERLKSSVGLRTLNQQVLKLGTTEGWCEAWEKGATPPVIRLDAIWLTVMFQSGAKEKDRLGRLRPVKVAKKVPILAAQAVWPLTGCTRLVAWMLADGEDHLSWQKFLERLWQAGLTPENGLKLLVTDGSTGFETAYQSRYWTIPHQRCVFHKLKNVARDLKLPKTMDMQARKQFSTAFLRETSKIWQAETKYCAKRLYETFCAKWKDQQPDAIETLGRDFEATLAFYDVQADAELRGEHWPARFLRTTSPLERMFREFRRRFDRAILFHSPTGLCAVTTQLANRFS
jgi:transposase-like protein